MSTRRLLLGRYELGEVIGSGATADVHRALDLESGTSVAVKLLREHLAKDALLRARFHREAATAARLHHPAIVAIHDTGYDEVDAGSEGTVRVPFIVMEHVAGRSLRDLLRIRPLSLNEAVRYQAGILAALDFSHRAGVVHRDIKPGNVIVTPTSAVKIVDFGIARRHHDPAATITQAQTFLGTPSYLSPEQARGEVAGTSSDLYSAGCVLHELLTGRPPFVGDDPVAVVYQHVHERPATVRTGFPALDAVVAKALAKQPRDRFPDAGAFREALLSATGWVREVRADAIARPVYHRPPARAAQGTARVAHAHR